ncbi:1-acyl-sn-glycerol-3-phosphate acyltransferase [Asticcacaulis taihuensis]|uniref:1-acyl-sn-glycerol-3-phosphate acyltransferase n=1 Tax=Asticcacaulis taihuensis TaxID=260084 RepID=A0A1G4ST51_9CAUL|nr:1-acyl-sn-glycerol-3-phosphate acyltransferase [Asticcacaulis taihuensis]
MSFLITRIRSLLFMLWLYGTMAFFGILCSPLLLFPIPAAMAVIRWWAGSVLFGARWIVGVKVEFRGLEHRPDGPALIAGKHLSMLDTIAPFVVLKRPAYVLKHSLIYLPFLGWYALRTKMVAIRREDAAKALKLMVSACRARLNEGRQILIFPEGTRSDVGDDPVYKPGVAALYRDLEVPCHLLATNSGQFWPGHGIDRKPGTVVFEFLPPLPAGLKRGELMAQMKERLETASNALVAEHAR